MTEKTYRLTEKNRADISDFMNPEGHNRKSVNWIKVLWSDDKGCMVEVGYWITYLNCRPKYQKENLYFNNSFLQNA